MPYNGSGTFNSLGVPTFPAVTGEFILASYFNSTMNDVFLGLSTALPRDGQAAMSANLPMAAYKITGLGNGSNPQDAVTFAQVFTGGSFTNPLFFGSVNMAGITSLSIGAGAAVVTGAGSNVLMAASLSVTVPSPAALDDSQQAAPTSFLVDYYANLTSPTFLGVPRAPTATGGTNTTQLATTEFVQSAAFATALPSQTGNSGKFVTTNGISASWAAVTESMKLLSTTTASASATVDIETTFDSTYSDYLLLVSEVVPATDVQILKVAFKQGGVYTGSLNVAYTDTTGGATTIGNVSANPASILTSPLRSNAATGPLSGEFFIKNPSGTASNKLVNYKTSHCASPGSVASVSGSICSIAATAFTGIRFQMAAGNIASGVFRLYGITKV